MSAVSTSCLKVASFAQIENAGSLDPLKEITSSIIERIIPQVELYRSGHINVRPVIAIAGCSAVGKSYFSRFLLKSLQEQKIHAKILEFDAFIEAGPVEGALSEYNTLFDQHKAHALLQKILNGEEIIEKPAWDETGPKSFKITQDFDLREVELLIFEGEFTVCDENTYDFLRYSNLRVIIDADDNDLIRWDWERARYLETDSFAEFTEWKVQRIAVYRKLLEPLKKYADYLVRKEGSHCYQLN